MTLFDWQQTDEARQAIAGAFPDVGLIECVRILHPTDLTGGWLWANWDTDVQATDALAQPVTFEARDFVLTIGRNSPSDAMENSGNLSTSFDERLYDFARALGVVGNAAPFTAELFWFLETDLTQPAFLPRRFWRAHRIRASKTRLEIEFGARTMQRTNGGARYTYEEWPTLRGWDFVQ